MNRPITTFAFEHKVRKLFDLDLLVQAVEDLLDAQLPPEKHSV
jgi:hypothetical protein